MIETHSYPLPENAPKLMPFQDLPFNGDEIAMQRVNELRIEFDLKEAVETGTCFGSTTQFLASIFDTVTTIENNRNYYYLALNRLLKVRNIEFVKGDSSQVLLKHIEKLTDKTFIFLDAHWEKSCPLIDELIQIGNAKLRPVIMIHDFKVPNHPELGYDSYNGIPFTFDYIKRQVERIYGFGNYNIEYNSQAVGAKRGIIYITPKKEQ
jgi:hypothetical protein